MKICSKCYLPKELNEFHNKKDSKDGKCPHCKLCLSLYHKNNKEKISIKHKLYLINNKEEVKTQQKLYYIKNRENIILNTRKYQNKHKEQIKEYTLNYIKKNKKIINIKRRIYIKSKYKNNISFRLSSLLRIRFYKALKKTNKSKSIIKLIGCDIDFLKKHLESLFLPEMTWDNHGEVWEIDHKIGCCNFDLTNYNQQAQCFHYSNQQPLFKTTTIAESFGYLNEIGNRNKSKKLSI